MAITGCNLNKAMADTNSEHSSPTQQTIKYDEDTQISIRSGGGGGKVFLWGGEDGNAARQANFDSGIGRDMKNLQEKYSTFFDEDGNVRPGFEADVKKAEMRWAQLQDEAKLADAVASEAEQRERMEAALKAGDMNGRAAAVDQKNAKSFAHHGHAAVNVRQGLAIGGNRN